VTGWQCSLEVSRRTTLGAAAALLLMMQGCATPQKPAPQPDVPAPDAADALRFDFGGGIGSS
jgi:hypothetical protein